MENSSGNRSTFRTRHLIEYFREYCNNTSIHGFRYFGERRTLFEKLWWLFIFICCLIVCSLSIIAVYRKWENSPVIVTFATKPMKIYDIPFPAITICSQSKINPAMFNLNKIKEMLKNNVSLSEKEQKYCNYAASLCYTTNEYCKEFIFYDDFYDIMEELTPTFFPINCYVSGIPTYCGGVFRPIITDEGICYTSNMLDRAELFGENVVHYKNFHKTENSSNWSMEHGYDKKAGFITYPLRALVAGLRYRFQFDLQTMPDNVDTSCRESLEGYTVLLHVPSRIPRLSQQQFRLPLNKAVVAAVKPYIITTASNVKKYSPKKRGCYFPSERKLRYFKIYSQNNCQLECLTNCTLTQCKCVSFYMPRENGTRICSGQDAGCELEAEYNCQINELLTKLENYTLSSSQKYVDCNCMPMCSDIEYNAVISQTDWNWTEDAVDGSDNIDENRTTDFYLSQFSVYFLSSDFIGSERSELYGPTDFLANFGGLLGLFTGFSFLSLMEIIYFLTIRICGNRRLYGFWAGPRPEEPQKQERY